MATVTGLTAARMLNIEAASVVDGAIDGAGHLILTTHGGTNIDAGNALVAVPEDSLVSYLSADDYTGTTPPTSYPDGVSLLYLDPTHTSASWPAFAGKRVVVHTINAVSGSGDISQTALRLNDTLVMEQYNRGSRSGVWGAWIKLSNTDDVAAAMVAPKIVTLTGAGPAESAGDTAYPLGVSLTQVGTGSGWSINNGFGNVVTFNQSNNRLFQMLITTSGGATGLANMWVRSYHTPEGWTPWTQMPNPKDPASFGMTGEIKMWSSSVIPSGWSLCDGTTLNRTTDAKLFAVIGTTYGVGDNSTTFNKPDLKGRVPVGFDGSVSEFNVMGKTGGEKTHVTTVAEMPAHTHVQDAHGHSFAGANGALTDGPTGVNYGLQNGTFYSFKSINPGSTVATNQSTGGGGAHNNLQPYLTIRYIIKH